VGASRRLQVAPRLGGLWLNKDFARYWAAQTISAAGDQITLLAIPLLAAITLHVSEVEMGLLAACETAPILILGLFAGVWTDRLRRRPILIAADFGRAALLLLIPIAWKLDFLNIGLLYVVAFLTGSLAVFFDVARQSYTPALVHRDELVDANSKVMISVSASEVAGPGLAGTLVKLVGAPVAILLDAASFVASGLFLLRIRKREPQVSRQDVHPNIWSEIREGLRWVIHDPILRTLTASTGIWNFFENARRAMLILYMTRNLDLGPGAIGAIMMVGGIGFLVGAFLPSWASKRFGLGGAILIAIVVIWIGEILYPLAVGSTEVAVPILVAAMFVEGLGGPSYDVNQFSLRQAVTPNRILGRVNGSTRVIIRGTVPLGALAGGAIAAAFGLRAAMVMGAFGPPIGFLLIWFSPVRKLKVPPPPVDEAVEDDPAIA
jgi:predicted MFS family arabinose efflux permease